MTAYLHDGEIKISTGCYIGHIDDFSKKVKEVHGENDHAKKYKKSLEFVRSVLCVDGIKK